MWNRTEPAHGGLCLLISPVLSSLRQEDLEFEASHGYIGKPSLGYIGRIYKNKNNACMHTQMYTQDTHQKYKYTKLTFRI